MISTTSGYKTKLESQSNSPRIRFLFFKDSITDTSIAFNENSPSADTITDSNNGFVSAGFQAGDMIIVRGATSNNGNYRIDTVTAGTITLIAADDLSDEVAGDTVTIIASRTSYDPYVLSVSNLRRDTRLSSGTAAVKLSNTDQTWNIFESTLANLGKAAQLKLYFSGDSEYISYFTGTVERVEYEKGSVLLHIRDKMAETLEIPLGSGGSPVPLYDPNGGYYNPADMVWTILTAYGGLDSTVGTGNMDIDYTAWNAWRTDCASKNYAIRARFTGQPIRHALLAIANRSNSYVWINHEGKFTFAPPYYSSSQTFGVGDCKKIDLAISKEELLNKYVVYYGYQHVPGPRIWTASHTLNDSTSQANYGVKEYTEEDTTVWHWNYDSAVSQATYKLNDYDTPVKWITMEAFMQGFITEIGDEVTVTESLKGLSSETVRITEIVSLNLSRGTTVLKGMMTT